LYKEVIPVFTSEDIGKIKKDLPHMDNAILNISKENVDTLYCDVQVLWKYADRININVVDLDRSFDLELYKLNLRKIKDDIVMEIHRSNFVNKEINVLTDILFMNKHNNCGAGDKAITLGPNGDFYV